MIAARISVPEDKVAQFCRRHGVRRLAFFGSVLTDRFLSTSDVDVLVDFRPGCHVGFFQLAEMEEELSSILGGRKVDLRTPRDLSVYFRDEVERKAVVAYAER